MNQGPSYEVGGTNLGNVDIAIFVLETKGRKPTGIVEGKRIMNAAKKDLQRWRGGRGHRALAFLFLNKRISSQDAGPILMSRKSWLNRKE